MRCLDVDWVWSVKIGVMGLGVFFFFCGEYGVRSYVE